MSCAKVQHLLREPLGGYLAVPLLELDADSSPAEVFGRPEGGARPSEGINNDTGRTCVE